MKSELNHKQWLEARIERLNTLNKEGFTDEHDNSIYELQIALTHLNSQLAKLPDNKDIILHARKRADEYSDNLGERIEIRENMREASRWMKEQIKRIIG